MRPSLLAVPLLAIFTSGCGSDGPPECEPGPALPDVNITLLDAQAAPVCNGVVTLVSAARTYEMRGRDDLCNLHSAHVAPDTYALTASAEGFTTATGTLVVSYADQRCGTATPTAQTITLQKP